jgi:hypothetical protein
MTLLYKECACVSAKHVYIKIQVYFHDEQKGENELIGKSYDIMSNHSHINHINYINHIMTISLS